MDFKLTDIAKEKMLEMKNNNEPVKLKITGFS